MLRTDLGAAKGTREWLSVEITHSLLRERKKKEMREVGRDEDEKRGGIKPKVRHRDRQTETERV